MHKIMTVVGTRPELIKMSLVIERLHRLTQHVLVHTGQNHDYELNQVVFDDLGIRVPITSWRLLAARRWRPSPES